MQFPYATIVITLVVLGAVLLLIPDQVKGECCHARGGVCGDCTRGTPHCGYKSCNLFGCDCPPTPPRGYVCRFGQCFRQRGKRDVDGTSFAASGDEETQPLATGDEVVRAGDVDGDDALSMDEAASFLKQYHNITRSKRSLFEGLDDLDKNHDGRLTVEEIDPQHRVQ